MKNEDQKRIDFLIRCNELYWEGADSPLTDPQWDKEMIWLRETYPNHPLLETLGDGKETEGETMLSLNKAYSKEEIEKWLKRVCRDKHELIVAEAKFDGLAGKLHKGELFTHDRGTKGRDISFKIPSINVVRNGERIPLQELTDENLILGEFICSYADFSNFGEGYKTPRNFVCGLINQKESIRKNLFVDFIEYKSSPRIEFTYSAWGKELWERIISFFENYSTYPKDGIVFKLVDRKHSKSLGVTSHHPIGAIAYKYQGEQGVSTLLSVDWQPGLGRLTPVANIEPVILGGVEVRRASLFNDDTVKKMDLRIGDTIHIERSGDVIPHILFSTPGKEWRGIVPLISHCPACREIVELDGIDLVCPNADCPGKIFCQLKKSIKEMEIDFLGDKAIEKIMDQKSVRYFYQLYTLTKYDLVNCGVGARMAEKIIEEIEKSKSCQAEKLLAALNIDGMGSVKWMKLLAVITFEDLISRNFTKEQLLKIPGIEKITARKIIQGLAQKKDEIEHLLQFVTICKREETNGEKICFTGKMPESRSYYETIAKERGFQPTDTVSKDLALLVCDDLSAASSKMKMAQKHGIKIVELSTWMKEE